MEGYETKIEDNHSDVKGASDDENVLERPSLC